MHDLRLAFRSVLRARGTSVLAVLALGLALGVNTGLFSLVHAVLLRALPFADPDRVAVVVLGSFNGSSTSPALSGADAAELGPRISAFSEVASWRNYAFNVAGSGNPERLPGAVASTRFFRVFPARVIAGRTFDSSLPVGTREAVISERLWRRLLDSDPAVIGRTLTLNGEPVPIVGVVASAFAVPPEAEIWMTPRFAVPDHPLRPLEDHSSVRGANYVEVGGRLAPGADLAAAQAQLDVYSRSVQERFPQTSEANLRLRAIGFREDLVGPVRPTLLLLWAAGLFTLLLACANVAALLLARALRRQSEMLVRIALGASRLQLLRLFFLEGLVLAVGGVLLGALLASLLPPLFLALWPHQLTREMLRPSPLVLAFTALLTLGTTLAISAGPALIRPAEGTLRAADRATTSGLGLTRARDLLVAGQIALTLVLLASAGLLLRSVGSLQGVTPGFDPRGVVTGSIWIPQPRYPDVDRQRTFYRTVLAALRTHPEVSDAAFASRIPFAGGNSSRSVEVPGQASPVDADYRLVTGDYFRTMHIPLREGRTFHDAEEFPGQRVAIVNEAFARQTFPGRDPLGLTVRMNEENLTIVGVVGDIRFVGLDRPPRPELYVPLGKEAWPLLNVVARGPASSTVLEAAVRDAVRAADPEQAFGRLMPLDRLVDQSLADRRQATELLAVVAGLALLLALTAIYGVVAHMVAQRTRELGIRMALGATAGRILREILLRAAPTLGLGLAVGLAAAVAAAPLLRGFLFHVEPHDPLTLAVVSVGLGLVAVLANLLAARRSSLADPVVALRTE